MKTDDLVRMLAQGAEPVPRYSTRNRLSLALAIGFVLSLMVMQTLFGARHDLMQSLSTPVQWVKFGAPLLLAVAGCTTLYRLTSPGVTAGSAWPLAVAVLIALWATAAILLAGLPDDLKAQAVLGSTWRTCPLNIVLTSLPILVALMWAARGLAITKPALAGCFAGLVAGGLGTMVYALHCPEHELPFIAVWYVLGMALVTAAGAALGPRLFRW
jgi:hypothetical protein